MPRLMSVSLTTEAVIDRTKTVTRRDGWRLLRPGDRLTLCRKVQGRKRKEGTVEPLERLAEVEVVSVRRESLDLIDWADVRREGFPIQSPSRFVRFFCETHKGVTPDTVITRIEWRYLNEADG